MLERALELGKINLSEDDPDVLATAYQLGTVLQRADDPMAARRVLEEAYAAGLWRLGDADRLMLEISHDIGVVAEELGNRHEARKAFGRVAELGPATLGAEHAAVARARAYLGQDPQSAVRGGAATPPQPAPSPPSMPSDATWQPRFTSPNPAPVPAHDPATPLNPAPHQGADEPTTTFRATTPTVEPPAPDDEQRWTAPQDATPPPEPTRRPPSPVEEPTAIHPAITPRPAPQPSTSENAAPPAPLQPAPLQPAPLQPAPPQPAPAPPHFGTPAPPPREPEPRYFEPQTWDSSQVTAPQTPAPAPAPHPFTPQYPGPQPQGPGPGLGEPAIIRSDSTQPLWGQGAPSAYPTEAPPSSYQKRGMGIFAAIAAVLAAVIAVAALVFVLANRSSDSGDNSDVPTLGGSPPTGVKIVDKGSSIKVSWVDPTQGSVSFLVAMGHPGEQLKPVTTLGPGQTSYEVSALNPSLQYCFAVVAVYRNNKFATSQQACTTRPAASATK